ncbi:sn-glycerol-3-phosphate ABC transporter ATPase [Escherichia coli]|nr:sn-glycerol-3-phosphate ABC transporter ATPase [Escherichia coli]
MVFQNYALLPQMSVQENLAWGPQIPGAGQQKIAVCVKEAGRSPGVGGL